MDLTSEQEDCVQLMEKMHNRIVSATGPAGTGKTTIMKQVAERLKAAGHNVVLAAPTGKAAKRISEATGLPAQTLHMLLEYGQPDEETNDSYPKRCRAFPLSQNVVMVDEYAMVSNELHNNLLAAMPRGASLRAFGDINQLAPVETKQAVRISGSPFSRMLRDFPKRELSKILRQGDASGIVKGASDILAGRMPTKGDDMRVFVPTELSIKAIDWLLESADFGKMENQIIVPTNVGMWGALALNALVQGRLMKGPHLVVPRLPWLVKKYKVAPIKIHQGEKVIFTKNFYGDDSCSFSFFNGETGIVEHTHDDGTLSVNLGDRMINLPTEVLTRTKFGMTRIDPRAMLDLAYAVTTHKAQGSEFVNVAYIMNMKAGPLLCRRNFYTAVTRAREKVTVISEARALSLSLARMDGAL